ncbi:hypothetical protein ACH5RR_015828 [Cinchona calisaya]|uniref:F-box domain-containing protein n=1 Tax=Cinchona calisaya TaxID=153742 RepID=A0ABD2ZV52_9GENT
MSKYTSLKMKRALVDNQNIDERKRRKRKKVKRMGIFCYIKDHNIEKALSLKMNRVSLDVQNIYSRKRKMEQQNIDEELSLKMMRTSLDDRNVDGRNEKKMKMGKNDGDDVVCGSERQTQQQKHYFPDDLVFELLLRLPIKDLHRFRCVSKDWGSIIFSPPFLEAYWRRLCYPSLLQVLGDAKPKENIFV